MKTLPRRFLGGGIALGVLAVTGWIALDRFVGAVVDDLRPELEQQLSTPLGHPLTIGAYQGLRPTGLALGPSSVGPGPRDGSTASVRSIHIGLDPLASLWRLKPVAVVRLRGVQLNLRRNAEGAYWVPGPAGKGSLPRLDLAIRLQDPARVRIIPAGLDVQLAGRAALQLDQSRGTAALKLALPEQGNVALRLKGDWREPQLDLQARVEKLRLRNLKGLIPASEPVSLEGQVGGNLRLAWDGEKARCQGGMSLVGFALTGSGLDAPVRSPQLQVSCKGDRLRIPTSRWTWGSYQAQLQGDVALNRAFNLRLKLHQPGEDRQLRAVLEGAWRQPRLRILGRWRLPEPLATQPPLSLQLQLSGDWRGQQPMRVHLDRLDLDGQGLGLRASGAVFPQLGIQSQRLELAGSGWKGIPLAPELLGQTTPVMGAFSFSGATNSPRVQLQLTQRLNPLLRDWSLQASWDAAEGVARLDRFQSDTLQARAVLPVRWRGTGAEIGALKGALQLQDFPLARLGPLVGTPMDGYLSASGTVQGPLKAVRPDLDLRLVNPQAGTLRLAETWWGRFQGQPSGISQLRMAAVNGLIGGSLRADLGGDWLPTKVTLQRQNGELVLEGTPASYSWRAERLPLDGLELALTPKGRWEGLYGDLSGQGTLGLQPLAMAGTFVLDQPGLLGVQVRQARLKGTYRDRVYQLTGEVLPPDGGQMLLEAKGRLGAGLKADLDARGLTARWLTRGVQRLAALNQPRVEADGDASDLGTLLVQTFGGSLEGQLKALNRVLNEQEQRDDAKRRSERFHPDDLRGQMDAQVTVSGPSLGDLNLELKASGHLWVEGDDVDHALQIEPFVATLSGPLQSGQGEFSLQHLPFTLLALVAPVPPALLGAVGLQGTYRLGKRVPELTTELVLEDARIGEHRLTLTKGQISLSEQGLLLDLALKDEAATEPVVVTGQVPLDPAGPLDVRVLTRGDGLRFLTGFTDDRLVWRDGDGRLRLILSGTLQAPQANGFLVVDKGSFELQGQQIRELNTSVVFDFNRLEVQSLQARVGQRGRLLGQGGLGLFSPSKEAKPLKLSLQQSRLDLPIAKVDVSAEIGISGALVSPMVSGDLEISHGTIRPAPSLFARRRSKSNQTDAATTGDSPAGETPVSINTLLEEKWDFQEPLVLLGPDVEADASRKLKAAMPKLPGLGFNNLRVTLGPKLAVSMGPLAAFTTKGRVTLNGALDPSLRLQGVVQLLTGRLSFFTTSFRLDRRLPNVAVFTPSMGLIPYVDVALVSRVSDSVSLGTGNNTLSTNVFETNGSGTLAAGGQLRLVKVMVEASGPANRLADSFTLRSSPPMPEAQLLGLIGGNSLAGLSSAGGGAALAAVLGQSLLTPVIGTLTDTLSERLQFALYPTYVSPEIKDSQERVSGRVPPQLAVVTELGLDLSERFNFSVIAAPNRNDIPPQGTLSYQINPNLSLNGSVDNQGTWQSQFQVFFRF